MIYQGSKIRIADDLVSVMFENQPLNRPYVEPFCGGCNVIDRVESKKRIASDNNKYLIAMWKELIRGWWPTHFYTEDEYYTIKDNKDKYPDYEVGWVGFVYSFRAIFFAKYVVGITFTNRKPGKNYGRLVTQDFYKQFTTSIKGQIPRLKNVTFIHSDYRKLRIPDNSIVYCDPPYEGVSGYKEKEKFNTEEFFQWVRELSNRCSVFVSEYVAPKDFRCIYSKSKKSTMGLGKYNRTAPARTEKLFIYEG